MRWHAKITTLCRIYRTDWYKTDMLCDGTLRSLPSVESIGQIGTRQTMCDGTLRSLPSLEFVGHIGTMQTMCDGTLRSLPSVESIGQIG